MKIENLKYKLNTIEIFLAKSMKIFLLCFKIIRNLE